MFLAWVLFPLVLLAVGTGCGLLVERAGGRPLPGALLPSVGLALVIVVATLMTYGSTTAPLTTALVLVLALAGYAVSFVRFEGSANGGRGAGWGGRPGHWRLSWGPVRSFTLEPWALVVGLAAFAVFAAPVVASGNATFLGYFVLNDTSVHFALIDQLLAHGRDYAAVPPSTLQSILGGYISTNYPIGSQVALGAVRPLVGQDIAWVFQPYLAVVMSLGAVCLYELLDGVVASKALRALSAFVAAQAGLLYAYYLEASIKELTSTWAITLTVVLVALTLRERLSLRRFVPLALAVVAAFDVLNLAIAPWLGVPLAVFVVTALWRARGAVERMSSRRLVFGSAVLLLAVAAIAAPVIGSAHKFLNVADTVLTRQGDLGNLVGPLVKWQMLGIWPSGDFRFPVVNHYRIAYMLLGIALASGGLGLAWALRRRHLAPLLLLAGNGLAAWYLLERASPYAGGKVMAIFSLTVVLIVMLGAGALHETGRRIEAWGLALVLAGGVLWTNAVAYRGASVAPRARLAELAEIGSRFSGQGPAFYNLSDEFAIHFIGREAPADPALAPPLPRKGLPPRESTEARDPWDPDELDEGYVQGFRLLVLGRSPQTSRPPADFQLVYRGRYFDVWRRVAGPKVLVHLPLGTRLAPLGQAPCRAVSSLAARARREHARLAYVNRPLNPTLVPTVSTRPPNWGEVAGQPYSLIPRQEPGAAAATLDVAANGRYEIWLQGSFSRQVQVWVDGREVSSSSFELGPPGQDVPAGSLRLSAGKHKVAIVVPPGDKLAPGVALVNQTIGPLALVHQPEEEPVTQIDPAHARELCGRLLDWIEIVRPNQ